MRLKRSLSLSCLGLFIFRNRLSFSLVPQLSLFRLFNSITVLPHCMEIAPLLVSLELHSCSSGLSLFLVLIHNKLYVTFIELKGTYLLRAPGNDDYRSKSYSTHRKQYCYYRRLRSIFLSHFLYLLPALTNKNAKHLLSTFAGGKKTLGQWRRQSCVF